MYVVTYLGPEPDTSLLQGLSLGLVYRGGKCGPHWELPPVPLEGILSHSWNEGYPGEQNGSEVPNNLTFQELVVDAPFVDQLGPIAKALSRVEVPQEHERHICLQAEVMCREPIRTQ